MQGDSKKCDKNEITNQWYMEANKIHIEQFRSSFREKERKCQIFNFFY